MPRLVSMLHGGGGGGFDIGQEKGKHPRDDHVQSVDYGRLYAKEGYENALMRDVFPREALLFESALPIPFERCGILNLKNVTLSS
jgi:hypothetical protein